MSDTICGEILPNIDKHCPIVYDGLVFNMLAASNKGRAKGRQLKSLSLPKLLVARIQAFADANFAGDFNRAVMEALRRDYPQEVNDFLRHNRTQKHSAKKY